MSGPWREPFERALQRNAPQAEVQVATVSPEGLPALRTVDFRGFSVEGQPLCWRLLGPSWVEQALTP